MLSKSTINELRGILQKDFNIKTDFKTCSEVAHFLVDYHDIFAQAQHRHKLKNDYDKKRKINGEMSKI